MNAQQAEAKKRLQGELRRRRQIVLPLTDKGESEDGKYVFTEIEGVTITIGPGGGYQIPAVRTYSPKRFFLTALKRLDTPIHTHAVDPCWLNLVIDGY